MSIPVHYQGQLVYFFATFTAVEGHEAGDVTAQCFVVAPDGSVEEVDLEPDADAQVNADQVAFVGTFRMPVDNELATLWGERWTTEGTIEGAVDRSFWLKRSAVVGAQEVPSA